MRRTHSLGLPWTSDQPIAEACTWATQRKQEKNIRAPSGIRARDFSNWAATYTTRPLESALSLNYKCNYSRTGEGLGRIKVMFVEPDCVFSWNLGLPLFMWRVRSDFYLWTFILYFVTCFCDTGGDRCTSHSFVIYFPRYFTNKNVRGKWEQNMFFVINLT